MARGEGKQRICETAVRLFNEQGYEAVSLRQIATEAGTTIGNLTYHFAHKEDLIASILVDLHAGFSERLDRTLAGGDLVARLVDLVVANGENHRRYPFYFENLSQLMVEFPSLKGENDAFARDIFEYYLWAFETLRTNGWLGEAMGKGETEALAYAMVDLQSSWVQASSPYRNEQLVKLPLEQVICTLLCMHVSAEHRPEFGAICDERGVEL